MKEVYVIYEENHGVIGIAENFIGVGLCLTTDGWLTLIEMTKVIKKGTYKTYLLFYLYIKALRFCTSSFTR